MNRFAQVPSAAIEDEQINAIDLAVLVALAYHTDAAGWCWPSQKVIAKRARVHPKTVSPSIKVLKARGYVEIHRPENGDLSKTSYRVILDTARAPAQADTQDTALAVLGGKGLTVEDGKLPAQPRKLPAVAGKASRPGRDKQDPPNKTIELKDPEPDPSAELFEEIWGAWTRKLKAEGHAGRGDGKSKTALLFAAKAKKTDPALIRSAALAWVAKSSGYLEGFCVWLRNERYDTGENVVSLRPQKPTDWPEVIRTCFTDGVWEPSLGPKPEQAGYRGPVEVTLSILDEYPFDHPIAAKVRANLQPERLPV